jgi:hypothetical protein
MLSLGLLIALACLAPGLAVAQTTPGTPEKHLHSWTPEAGVPADQTVPVPSESVEESSQQKRPMTRAKLEMSKKDATELATLAKGLRELLDKPNVDGLSRDVIDRAEKIQKLARKIREESKGI